MEIKLLWFILFLDTQPDLPLDLTAISKLVEEARI
jgi:hypothetical protein